MTSLWRDAVNDGPLLFNIKNEPVPAENLELSKILRKLFGKPFVRGYNSDFKNTNILSIIYAGAAEVHVINSEHIIGALSCYSGLSVSKLYGQIAALYSQHLAHGRKVRISCQNQLAYRVNLAIIRFVNKENFGSNLQFNLKNNHNFIDGSLHEAVYEVKSTWISTALLKRETN